jgi:hypothetical protein
MNQATTSNRKRIGDALFALIDAPLTITELMEVLSAAKAEQGRADPDEESTASQRMIYSIRARVGHLLMLHDLARDAVSWAEIPEIVGLNEVTIVDALLDDRFLSLFWRGETIYPRWQFDRSRPDLLLAGVNDVNEELMQRMDMLTVIAWMRRALPALGGATPLDMLRQGRVASVLAAAQSAGVE